MGKKLTVSASHTIVLRLYDVDSDFSYLSLILPIPTLPNMTYGGTPQAPVLKRKAFPSYCHLPSVSRVALFKRNVR